MDESRIFIIDRIQIGNMHARELRRREETQTGGIVNRRVGIYGFGAVSAAKSGRPVTSMVHNVIGNRNDGQLRDEDDDPALGL